MNILMLYDGGSDLVKYKDIDAYLQKYRVIFHKLGHYIKISKLENLQSSDERINLHYILRDLNEADLLIFVSPIFNGRFTELMIKTQSGIFDYFTYILKDNNHNHNLSESNFKIPNLGVITESSNSNKQEQLLCRLTQETNAAKYHTLLSFFITINERHSDAVFETLKSFSRQKTYSNPVNESKVVNN